MIDYMLIANFLEENYGDFCNGACGGDDDFASEQIDLLREKASESCTRTL